MWTALCGDKSVVAPPTCRARRRGERTDRRQVRKSRISPTTNGRTSNEAELSENLQSLLSVLADISSGQLVPSWDVVSGVVARQCGDIDGLKD